MRWPLGWGRILFSSGAITIGSVYIIFHYTELLTGPIEQIRTQLQDLQKADAGIARVAELLQTRSRISRGDRDALPAGALAVAFEDVSFAYEADEPVLEQISFTLAPGQVLGLLGRTGSGKTTLARLLLRLYDPTAGAVRLGGVDLRAAGAGRPAAACRAGDAGCAVVQCDGARQFDLF